MSDIERKDGSLPVGETPVSADTPAASEHSADPQSATDRRSFLTGVATVIAGGAVVGAAASLSSSEASAVEVRRRIVSRIQNELAQSNSEDVMGHDKSNGGHDRYLKNP